MDHVNEPVAQDPSDTLELELRVDDQGVSLCPISPVAVDPGMPGIKAYGMRVAGPALVRELMLACQEALATGAGRMVIADGGSHLGVIVLRPYEPDRGSTETERGKPVVDEKQIVLSSGPLMHRRLPTRERHRRRNW